MTSFDDQRATAIIERAIEHQMYTGNAVPATEAARVIEAEKIVAMARQVEGIKDHFVQTEGVGLDEESLRRLILDRVPPWPHIEAILIEANMLVGTSEPETNGTASAVHPDLAKLAEPTSEEITRKEQLTAMAAATSQPETERDYPKAGEVWLDTQGQEWRAEKDGEGQTVEATLLRTGEVTLIPTGMLKVRKLTEQQEEEWAREQGPPRPSDGDLHDEPEQQELPSAPPASQDVAKGEERESSEPAQSAPVPEAPPPDKKIDPATTAPPSHDDEGDEAYQTLLEDTEQRYAPAGMPIPHELVDAPSIMPEDLYEVPDAEARKLHSKFNALAARAKYLHDVEDARARGCNITRKLFLRGAKRKAREELGSSSTMTEREEWAVDNDENVVLWTERANRHAEEASAYKTFFDIYSQHVVVLSRDWTMRDKQLHS